VQSRQSGESVPAAHTVRHLSLPHWTTAPQHSAQFRERLRPSFMQVAVQLAAPRQRRPHSPTLRAISARLVPQSPVLTQAPGARPQLTTTLPLSGAVWPASRGAGAPAPSGDGAPVGGGGAVLVIGVPGPSVALQAPRAINVRGNNQFRNLQSTIWRRGHIKLSPPGQA
jgi:hypothetical protein